MKLLFFFALLITLCFQTGRSEKQLVASNVDYVEFVYPDGFVYLPDYEVLNWRDYFFYYDCYSRAVFPPYSCCVTNSLVCVSAFRKKDNSLIEKAEAKIEEEIKNKGIKVDKKPLREALAEELKLIKKDLANNEEASLDGYRKGKIFSKDSLTKEVQKNRILELEKFIQEKKQNTKK